MNKYENLCCPVCHAKFFEDDDIVVCPICGAPHHRDCYKYEGHCHFESDHGTENQWKMPEVSEPTLYCKHCGEPMKVGQEFCSACGKMQNDESEQNTEQNDQQPNFGGFNPQDGMNFNPDFAKMYNINPDEEIDKDITAGDVLNFTGPQGFRYLNIYKRQLKSGGRVGWNWISFLFPEIWLFARKMWFLAVPTFIINCVLSAMTLILIEPYMQNAMSYFDIANSLSPNDMKFVGMFGICLLIIKVFFGMFGDYFYRQHSFKKIRQLKLQNTTDKLDFLQAGSVNVLVIFISYFASSALVHLLVILLQNLRF